MYVSMYVPYVYFVCMFIQMLGAILLTVVVPVSLGGIREN